MEMLKLKDKRSWVNALSVFVCGLLLLELVLRVFVYRCNLTLIDEPDWQSQIAAGSSCFLTLEGHGNTNYEATNEIATPYTTGASVLVIGESYTEGLQVNQNEKYVSIAEKILHERGVDADLHNFGKSSQLLADDIWLYMRIHEQYKPKIAVIQLSLRSFSTGYDDTNFDNYFIKQSDGSIQLIRKSTKVEPRNKLLRYLNQNISTLGYGFYIRLPDIRNNIKEKNLNLQRQNEDMADNQAIEDDKTILAKISILKQEVGEVKLVILLAPRFPLIIKNNIILDDLQYDHVVSLIRNIPDIVVIDPSASFVNSYKNNRCHSGFVNSLPCTGHWNNEGNEIVGRLLADELEKIMK